MVGTAASHPAVAGLLVSSNVASADANNAGQLLELDAILAVALGGTSLAGGRYTQTLLAPAHINWQPGEPVQVRYAPDNPANFVPIT